MAFLASPSTALESLSESIAGFNGYEKCNDRKPSDHHLRDFLIAEIEKVLAALGAIPPAAQEEDQRRLTELSQSTRRKLSTICQSLKDPTYAGQDFFSLEKLAEKRLQRIYFHENHMLEELVGIHTEISSLQASSVDKESIEDHYLHVSDFIDNLNQALFERECLILGNQ